MAGLTRSFSGARCRIMLDAKQVGWATGVEVNEDIGLVRVDVMDDPYTQEIEPVGITVSGQVSQVVIYGNTLASDANSKLYPQGNKLSIVLKKAITMTIVDSVEGKVLFSIQGMKFSSRHHNVDRNSVMMSSATFQAIRLTALNQDATV